MAAKKRTDIQVVCLYCHLCWYCNSILWQLSHGLPFVLASTHMGLTLVHIPKVCYLERFCKQQFLPKPSSNRNKQQTSLTQLSHSNCSGSNLNYDHIGRLWVSAQSWHNSLTPSCSSYDENISLHSMSTAGNSDNDQTAETFTLSGKAMRSEKKLCRAWIH